MDAQPSNFLRVLHWNVHSWINPDTGASNAGALEALLTEHEPHLVSLVEVDEPWDKQSALEAVAEQHGYAAVFAPIFEYGSATPIGGFGNAVLSRLPIAAVGQRQLTWPTSVYDGTEPSEPRSLTLVRVQLGAGALLSIGSTHLPRADAPAREQALNALSNHLEALPTPWIICGDFNAAANEWPLTQRWTVAPSVPTPTYPAATLAEPIDYAVSSGVDLTARVLTAQGSDHLPVLFLVHFD